MQHVDIANINNKLLFYLLLFQTLFDFDALLAMGVLSFFTVETLLWWDQLEVLSLGGFPGKTFWLLVIFHLEMFAGWINLCPWKRLVFKDTIIPGFSLLDLRHLSVLSKVEANSTHLLKSSSFFTEALWCKERKNLQINKPVRVEMTESLKGVFMPKEGSGFINWMALQRCDLVKLDHASENLLLRKQMLLWIVFGMNKKKSESKPLQSSLTSS